MPERGIGYRVAVLASGGGTNLQALLDACQGAGTTARVAFVASDNPAAGALERARKAGVATAIITNPRDGPALTGLLRESGVDLVVLAGYLKLIPPETVAAFEGRMINIHPALLPDFGGPGMYGHHVHDAVIAAGATESGATVHLVTVEYDRGPVIAQWRVPVRPGETPQDLAARILAVEHELLPAVVLAAAAAGRVVPLVRRVDARGDRVDMVPA